MKFFRWGCSSATARFSATKPAAKRWWWTRATRWTEILAVVARHGLEVTAIVVTHAHIDHIGGAQKLSAATGAPVYMNEEDRTSRTCWTCRRRGWG